VREFTYSPTIPDADQNAVTLGLRYRAGGHTAEVAWGGIFYNDRNIASNQTPAFQGEYEVVVHLISLGYTYRF
jgi:long-subunit fatty acid transport protein